MAESLKHEPKSSPTKLLAGVIYYLVCKNFGGGCTQTLVVNNFDLKNKNVALCITGQKYLGGKDKQSGTKCKAADDMHRNQKGPAKKRTTMTKIKKHNRFTDRLKGNVWLGE